VSCCHKGVSSAACEPVHILRHTDRRHHTDSYQPACIVMLGILPVVKSCL
jgi:hypothetical protein